MARIVNKKFHTNHSPYKFYHILIIYYLSIYLLIIFEFERKIGQ